MPAQRYTTLSLSDLGCAMRSKETYRPTKVLPLSGPASRTHPLTGGPPAKITHGLLTLRLLNALNSEDRGLKVRFSLVTIAFDRESAQMSQILLSQGKNAPSNPYPHYLMRLATSRKDNIEIFPAIHKAQTPRP